MDHFADTAAWRAMYRLSAHSALADTVARKDILFETAQSALAVYVVE
jgi:hypothetical protein